jgi:hypothetical protein
MNALITKEQEQELFRKNSKIDAGLVVKFEAIEAQLRKIGVSFRTTYNLAPPLGYGVRYFVFSQSDDAEQ